MRKGQILKEVSNLNQEESSRNNLQEEKDKLKKKKKSFIRQLPKGLNNVTLSKIKGFMGSTDDKSSTKEVAKNLGLSRVTVQRYLKYMADEELVDVVREYGEVGRPKHYYRLLE
jgi:response regulator of citrate/malate metabolism